MKYILYIEDNPDQLVLVRTLLEHELAVLVDVCCTSKGAEVFLNQRCYDVIISDVNLPGELGIDIAERILERDRGQPIYLMSEYRGQDVKGPAESIGLELHKKFSDREPDEFVNDIRKMLEQRPCDSAIANPPGGLGGTAENAGGNGEAAERDHRGNAAATRVNDSDTPADVTSGNYAEEISRRRPTKSIRLSSPYVLAARASLG